MADVFPGRENSRKQQSTLMARDEEDSVNSDSRSNDDIDRYFGTAHPNPTHLGCLTGEHIRALARRERGISDPGYEHLEQCSPCYREFLKHQRGANGRPSHGRRWIAVAAMIAVVVSGTAVFVAVHRPDTVGTATTKNELPVKTAVFDLRPFVNPRGGEEAVAVEPLHFSRSEVVAEILLPVGFEAGTYELRLVSGNRQSIVNERVTSAAMKNYIAVINTRFDLRSASPGPYQLELRAPGEDWHSYPARIE